MSMKLKDTGTIFGVDLEATIRSFEAHAKRRGSPPVTAPEPEPKNEALDKETLLKKAADKGRYLSVKA